LGSDFEGLPEIFSTKPSLIVGLKPALRRAAAPVP
jgi:hypothetical protein